MLGLTGAGLVCSRYPEIFSEGPGHLKELLVRLGRSAEPGASPTAYASFLRALDLRHLQVKTILSPHFNRHGNVQNTMPPESLWTNIIPTLRVIDTLAAELGERVTINSAYRSPAYNSTCPGAAKSSQHIRNAAVDIQFRSSPLAVATLARKLRAEGLFKGGVGLYQSFTHIDTRGRNADW